MPWPITGATYYHAHCTVSTFRQIRAIKGLVVCNGRDVSALGPVKQSGPKLLSTVLVSYYIEILKPAPAALCHDLGLKDKGRSIKATNTVK